MKISKNVLFVISSVMLFFNVFYGQNSSEKNTNANTANRNPTNTAVSNQTNLNTNRSTNNSSQFGSSSQ